MDLPHILGICFAGLIFLLVIWTVLSFVVSSIIHSVGFWLEEIKVRKLMRAPYLLQEKYELVILKKFPYYSTLSDKAKIKFLLRLHRFIRSKKFTGKEGLEITEEMKTLIGASAIQLTFGLEYYWLSYFEEIILYPDIFRNVFLDEYHKGETNIKGIVVLSWKHFVEGYDDATDKLNLGLHELAHALDLCRLVNDGDNYFKEYYIKWFFISKGEFENMQDHIGFLRAYGGVNFREFFAVCVEHFFEAPAEFKQRLPEIYKHLTILLRQDPLTTIEKTELELVLMENTVSFSELNDSPEFSNRISLWDTLFALNTLLFRIVGTSFALFIALKSHLFLLMVVIGVLVYYFNALLFTKFELLKQHLIIRRPLLLNRLYSFSYDNIIHIEFRHDSTDNVLITYFDKGKILKFNALCAIPTKDEERLLRMLSERNVITKSVVY